MTKPVPVMSADEFADRARRIVETLNGHAAHRAIDLVPDAAEPRADGIEPL